MADPFSSTISLKLSGSPTQSNPCHVCLDLNLIGRSSRDPWYKIPDSTYEEIIAAAELGCRGCKILQFAVKPKFEEWGTQSIKLRIKQFPDETSIWVETNSHSHGRRAAKVELHKLPGQDDSP
jgi:hypothetical protein